MTPEQATVMQETHDAVIKITAKLEERCPVHQRNVLEMMAFVNGSNGNKGAKERLGLIERHNKVFWATACGVFGLAGEYFIRIFR
jgi:hypothetical protein